MIHPGLKLLSLASDPKYGKLARIALKFYPRFPEIRSVFPEINNDYLAIVCESGEVFRFFDRTPKTLKRFKPIPEKFNLIPDWLKKEKHELVFFSHQYYAFPHGTLISVVYLPELGVTVEYKLQRDYILTTKSFWDLDPRPVLQFFLELPKSFDGKLEVQKNICAFEIRKKTCRERLTFQGPMISYSGLTEIPEPGPLPDTKLFRSVLDFLTENGKEAIMAKYYYALSRTVEEFEITFARSGALEYRLRRRR